MEPTPRALSLKEPVRDVLIRVEAAVVTQPLFDPENSDREFRLTVSDYTNAVVMPHVLEGVHRQARKVRFQLLPQAVNPKRALENGDADLMIIPALFASTEHPSDPLFTERFCSLVWRGSPLAHGKLTLERYLAHGHVVMEPPQCPSLRDQGAGGARHSSTGGRHHLQLRHGTAPHRRHLAHRHAAQASCASS